VTITPDSMRDVLSRMPLPAKVEFFFQGPLDRLWVEGALSSLQMLRREIGLTFFGQVLPEEVFFVGEATSPHDGCLRQRG